MTIKFTNNAATTLASGITNVATSLTVASGKGALFPTLSGGDVFYATLANSSGVVEIVQVTARSTDTFTIVRGQDGTTAVAWNTGDKVELRPTAGVLGAMVQSANLSTSAVTTFNTRQGAVTLTSSDVTTALTYTPYNSTNPSGYTNNTGTVTSVATGNGLTGGTITGSGTISLDYYTGSTSTNNTFPIGSYVLGGGGIGANSYVRGLLNAAVTVYVITAPTANAGHGFVTSTGGGGSAVSALAGTWRFRGGGYATTDGCCMAASASPWLFQRTA